MRLDFFNLHGLFAHLVEDRFHLVVDLLHLRRRQPAAVDKERHLQREGIVVGVGGVDREPKLERFREPQPLRMIVADQLTAGLNHAARLGFAPDPAAEARAGLENGDVAMANQRISRHQAGEATADDCHLGSRLFVQGKSRPPFGDGRRLPLLAHLGAYERLAFGAGDFAAIPPMQTRENRTHRTASCFNAAAGGRARPRVSN